MPSPIYQQFNPQSNLLGMLQQFRSNPMGMLAKKYNIPQNLNNPNDIIQHLLNTKQVSQEQVNRAMQMGNNPQIKNLLK